MVTSSAGCIINHRPATAAETRLPPRTTHTGTPKLYSALSPWVTSPPSPKTNWSICQQRQGCRSVTGSTILHLCWYLGSPGSLWASAGIATQPHTQPPVSSNGLFATFCKYKTFFLTYLSTELKTTAAQTCPVSCLQAAWLALPYYYFPGEEQIST